MSSFQWCSAGFYALMSKDRNTYIQVQHKADSKSKTCTVVDLHLQQENYLIQINCTRKTLESRTVRKQSNINHTVILIHYTSGFAIPIFVHLQTNNTISTVPNRTIQLYLDLLASCTHRHCNLQVRALLNQENMKQTANTRLPNLLACSKVDTEERIL